MPHLADLVGVFCLRFGATVHAGFGVLEEHRIVSHSQMTLRHRLAIMGDDAAQTGSVIRAPSDAPAGRGRGSC